MPSKWWSTLFENLDFPVGWKQQTVLKEYFCDNTLVWFLRRFGHHHTFWLIWISSQNSFITLTTQPVWPDWAIFKRSLLKKYHKNKQNIRQLLGLLRQITHFKENCCGFILGIFWKNWATFYSNIWSHCTRQKKVFCKKLAIEQIIQHMVRRKRQNDEIKLIERFCVIKPW